MISFRREDKPDMNISVAIVEASQVAIVLFLVIAVGFLAYDSARYVARQLVAAGRFLFGRARRNTQ
jgi:hypothetical protein